MGRWPKRKSSHAEFGVEYTRRAEAATGNPAPNVEFTAAGEGSVRVKATFKFKSHFSATNRGN